MIGIILASHGKFAEGFYDALVMFSGEIEQIECVSLNPDENLVDFSKKIKSAIDNVDSGDGVVIFCDLLFGTPSNVAASLLNDTNYKNRIEIISGINLATVLEFTNMRGEDIDRLHLLDVGRKGIESVNNIVNNQFI